MHALALVSPAEVVTDAREDDRPDDPDLPLVERFKSGERRAFDELVRRHQTALWRMARRYVKNDADAADVVQQAFVRAPLFDERLHVIAAAQHVLDAGWV